MALQDHIAITVDEAVTYIQPDVIGCMNDMNLGFTAEAHLDLSMQLTLPDSLSTFEVPPADSHSKMEITRQSSPANASSSDAALPPSIRRGRQANPWTTEELAVFLDGLKRFCPRAALPTQSGQETFSVGLGRGVAQKIADALGTRDAIPRAEVLLVEAEQAH
eukprot:813028-Rhodomonas_salina.2